MAFSSLGQNIQEIYKQSWGPCLCFFLFRTPLFFPSCSPGGGFEKKVEWFRAALFALLMHAPIAEDFEALPLLQVDRRRGLRGVRATRKHCPVPGVCCFFFGGRRGGRVCFSCIVFLFFAGEMNRVVWKLYFRSVAQWGCFLVPFCLFPFWARERGKVNRPLFWGRGSVSDQPTKDIWAS